MKNVSQNKYYVNLSKVVENVTDYMNEIYLNQRFTFYKVVICLWFLWLLIGTIFYTFVMGISGFRGFYIAVNVGYSIGWANISEGSHNNAKWFSVFFLLVGASFVGAALNAFSEYIVTEEKNWYIRELDKNKYLIDVKRAKYDYNIAEVIRLWAVYNWTRFEAVFLWCFCLIISTSCACTFNDWRFIDGFYFSLSCLSTGGIVALPDDAPEIFYGLTGLFCAVGVPLMALSMASIVSVLHSQIDLSLIHI